MFMKASFTLFLFLLSASLVQAQTRQQVSLDLNRSFHGTGDMRGVGFAIEYGRYVSRKLELTGGLSTNLHHDVFPLYVTDLGQVRDASYRMVTGGIQFNGVANYAPLHTTAHELKVGVGTLLRYQVSSVADSYGIYYPAATNFPEPVFSFRNSEDQKLFTIGYQVAVSYAYTFPGRYFLGAKASFQNDSNADVITQYGLRIGKRF